MTKSSESDGVIVVVILGNFPNEMPELLALIILLLLVYVRVCSMSCMVPVVIVYVSIVS